MDARIHRSRSPNLESTNQGRPIGRSPINSLSVVKNPLYLPLGALCVLREPPVLPIGTSHLWLKFSVSGHAI